MVSWWVLGAPDRKQFVSWSCGSLDGLENAAVYRSKANAEKKLKNLSKYGYADLYKGIVPHEVFVSLDAVTGRGVYSDGSAVIF